MHNYEQTINLKQNYQYFRVRLQCLHFIMLHYRLYLEQNSQSSRFQTRWNAITNFTDIEKSLKEVIELCH
jgi:hypothetical protein